MSIPPTLTSEIFSNSVYKYATLYVPTHAVANYKQKYWDSFKDIQPYEYAGTESITVDFDDIISVEDGGLTITSDTEISVYRTDGTCVWRGKEGQINPGRGVYIIKTNNQSRKVVL